MKAEFRKLIYTRSVTLLLFVMLFITVAGAAVFTFAAKPEDIPERFSQLPFLKFGATNVGLVLLILGVRAYGDETNHRTLASTSLLTPRRHRVLAAKAAVAVVTAVTFSLVAHSLVITIAALGDLHVTMDTAATASLVARNVLSLSLLTLLGVGVGAVVRNRSAALVGTVVWLAILESAIRGIKPGIGKWLPGQAAADLIATGTATAPGHLAPAVAGGALVAVTLLALGLATASLRRDVA